jgi:hypothetical protein
MDTLVKSFTLEQIQILKSIIEKKKNSQETKKIVPEKTLELYLEEVILEYADHIRSELEKIKKTEEEYCEKIKKEEKKRKHEEYCRYYMMGLKKTKLTPKEEEELRLDMALDGTMFP